MVSLTKTEGRPHAVCIPFPVQGHIKPMLSLAKLLHRKGFHITFVNTEFNHKRLVKTNSSSLKGHDSFRFEKIPDGLPPSDPDTTQSFASLCEAVMFNCLAPFKELLAKLNNTVSSAGNEPPVSCIVSDMFMFFTVEAAQELGIPNVVFWTSGALALLTLTQSRKLFEKGYVPMKDASYLTNGHLDVTHVDDIIPAMNGMRLRDLPSFIRTTNLEDPVLYFMSQVLMTSARVSGIVLNTFEDLESDIINAISSFMPPIFSVGPLHVLDKVHGDDDESEILGPNLWKEEAECLEWLNSQETDSVIYVSFGSITMMTHDQLVEFAMGLALVSDKISFLWAMRPDIVQSGEVFVLPPEFLEAIKERGWLVKWCPQENVLSHPSIGGFLTHSGWNSTLESICCGVPMICWPFFADQQPNCWSCCTKWGIGMEVPSDVKRDEVINLVNELMCGAKGKNMKKNAMKWKKLANDFATSLAYENLDKMIHQLLLPNV